MRRLYSKGFEYAIRALAHLGPDRYEERFQALVRGGSLQAMRGPSEGHVLTHPPEAISLLGAIMRRARSETKEGLQKQLESVTLRDLMETLRRREGGWPFGQPLTDLVAAGN